MKNEIIEEDVRAFFEREAGAGRRLFPDENTISGLGSLIKYREAVARMRNDLVHDVLDVGCNRGSIEAYFHRSFPDEARRTRVEGVDISEIVVQQAMELNLPGCHFQSYDGHVLPFATESFDLVILVEVIEHVPDKQRLLSEISRVLRPSGELFLTTPNPDCWPLRAELMLWRFLRKVFGRKPPGKDAFISQVDLISEARAQGLMASDAQQMYMWPHLFIYFQGWGLIPPLSPALLYRYQRICLSFDLSRWPFWLKRRVCWTTKGSFRREAAAEATKES